MKSSVAMNINQIVSTSNLAVGMLCRDIKSFENVFDPSMRAALAVGPKQFIPTKINGVVENITFPEVRFYTIHEGSFRARDDKVDVVIHSKLY
jgi:hypothetical protein